MDLKRSLKISVILSGITAMVSQIIFLREFLVVFCGNEISVGIVLAGWLLWGALGSYVSGHFSDRIRDKAMVFSLCLVSLVVILPLAFFALRASKSLMGIATGEIIGYIPMVIAAFTVLSLPCAVMGFMFSLACGMLGELEGPKGGEGIARVYVWEALGALSGGLIASYVLIRLIPPFYIISILVFCSVFAALIIALHIKKAAPRKVILSLGMVITAILATSILFGGIEKAREVSLSTLWKGYDVTASRDSIYGNITVTRRGEQVSFYENGLGLYSVPDKLIAEETVHFAMLENAAPKNVLLIGGGVGGALQEILKYPVENIDYVELDPMIIKMAGKYLEGEDRAVFSEKKVHIINTDGRLYVKRTSLKYDVVIVDLGDPYTAQLNRFYTVDFFEEVKNIMNPGGVLSFSLTSSENYIGGELKEYLGSVYAGLCKVFPDTFLIPGETMYFLASGSKGTLVKDQNTLVERLKERGIKTDFVREYYLFAKLSPERLEYAEKTVGDAVAPRLNTDFRPLSYFYAIAFWGAQFDTPGFRKFLHSVSSYNIWLASVLICALILVFGLFQNGRRIKNIVLLAVMTTGFAEIVFQMVIILSFQVIYGFVFYKLGIIIASFMVGTGLGAWFISRRLPDMKNEAGCFTRTQAAICIYPLIIPVIFIWLSRSSSPFLSWAGSNVIFPFLPVISGFIGGIQFPLANRIYLGSSGQTGRSSGLSYSLDLAGACVGALVAAAFLMPVLGIFGTCFLAALINVTVLAVLAVRVNG